MRRPDRQPNPSVWNRRHGFCRSASIWMTDRRLFPALLSPKAEGVLKLRLRELAELDPAPLPYNATLLAYLRDEKAAGRLLV